MMDKDILSYDELGMIISALQGELDCMEDMREDCLEYESEEELEVRMTKTENLLIKVSAMQDAIGRLKIRKMSEV